MSVPIPAPSLAVVKKLSRQLDVLPQREAGQNFLIDPRVAERLLTAAQLKSTDTVLEIGPGFGWLTQRLAEQVQRVVTVELEKRFIPWLQEHLPDSVSVIQSNILELDLRNTLVDREYVLVSFLPYSITAKVMRQFLTQAPRPRRLAMVIQKEVAERICAGPGKQSKLSIMVQRYGLPTLGEMIPPTAFWPAPAVDSAIITIDLRSERDAAADENFWQLVRIGFSSRRKTLSNNLINGYRLTRSEIAEVIKSANLSQKSRPQELSIDDWDRLANVLQKKTSAR